MSVEHRRTMTVDEWRAKRGLKPLRSAPSKNLAQKETELEAELAALERGNREMEAQLERNKTRRRDEILNRAIRQGRIFESDRAKWSKRYDEDPDFVRSVFDDLHPSAPAIAEKMIYTREDFGETIEPGVIEREAIAARFGLSARDVI